MEQVAGDLAFHWPQEVDGRNMEIHGSGDITPLAGALSELGHIEFTGLRYGSDRDGAAVTVAEAENTTSGQFDHDTLDAIAEVAAYLPRL
ncbi:MULTISPECIES: hypothetical protein [unclassified Saccharothrix]|uniref:hypothetical protein n=1 Tax=unclassified Saccharothrix TaxID=2593673 RepID=UPI00307D5F6B